MSMWQGRTPPIAVLGRSLKAIREVIERFSTRFLSIKRVAKQGAQASVLAEQQLPFRPESSTVDHGHGIDLRLGELPERVRAQRREPLDTRIELRQSAAVWFFELDLQRQPSAQHVARGDAQPRYVVVTKESCVVRHESSSIEVRQGHEVGVRQSVLLQPASQCNPPKKTTGLKSGEI